MRMFYILLRKESHSSSKVLKVVTPILEEFKDLFLIELPQGLPPLRDIHQIDLIPDSTLPNRLLYRMSSIEYEGLRN